MKFDLLLMESLLESIERLQFELVKLHVLKRFSIEIQKAYLNLRDKPCFLYGAEGGTRTRTTLRPLDFEFRTSIYLFLFLACQE